MIMIQFVNIQHCDKTTCTFTYIKFDGAKHCNKSTCTYFKFNGAKRCTQTGCMPCCLKIMSILHVFI